MAKIRERVATVAGLSTRDRSVTMANGLQPIFHNRLSWSLSHLKGAGLVAGSRRGYHGLTEKGRGILAAGSQVDVRFLRTVPRYQEWIKRSRGSAKATASTGNSGDRGRGSHLRSGASRLARERLEEASGFSLVPVDDHGSPWRHCSTGGGGETEL